MKPEDRVGQLIRTRHPYGFRYGQWAMIVKFSPLTEGRHTGRECWLVEFPDGMQDHWPVVDSMAQYQFATIEEG